ncbi:unnamed protein product [Polarella glacialis]|uniref:Uncharacterized protein n=1 Tax=Polarella glacialis TaxID=89957 RepID=A0A813KBU3_POLGL|nr:unnamed protein product [Polarella glacialis]
MIGMQSYFASEAVTGLGDISQAVTISLHLSTPGEAMRPSLLEGALEHHGALIQSIFLDDLALVEHVELLSGIPSGEHHDGLAATRVIFHELGHVENVFTHDHPAIRLAGMLGNLLSRERHRWKAARQEVGKAEVSCVA